MVSVLFVCLGNICRSPAAEGIFKHLLNKESLDVHVESCGLGDWWIGQLPDERMREAAHSRGIILTSRAQKVHPKFFDQFDLILAADHKVLHELYKHLKDPAHKSKIYLITHFSTSYHEQEGPDPYYGGEAGFEHVLNMIEDACEGLLQHIKSQDLYRQDSTQKHKK